MRRSRRKRRNAKRPNDKVRDGSLFESERNRGQCDAHSVHMRPQTALTLVEAGDPNGLARDSLDNTTNSGLPLGRNPLFETPSEQDLFV